MLQQNIILVNNDPTYKKAVKAIAASDMLAIDLEFDDNKYHYGRKLCLVQIFDRKHVYLFDPLALSSIDELLQILRNSQVTKLFHSCSSDLLILDELFDCRMTNIADTALMNKIVSANLQDIGLKTILSERLGIEVEKSEQTSNWNYRPLRAEQIVYAARDVYHLFELHDLLCDELHAIGRMHWYEEEALQLEKIKYNSDKKTFENSLHKNKVARTDAPLYEEYWKIRDEIARKLDKPAYQIISDARLAQYAKTPPANIFEWQSIGSCHPMLTSRHYAERLIEATKKVIQKRAKVKSEALRADWVIGHIRAGLPNLFQFHIQEKERCIGQLKGFLTEKHGDGLQKLILPNKYKDAYIWDGLDMLLRNWQLDLIEEVCIEKGLDFELLRFPLPIYPR